MKKTLFLLTLLLFTVVLSTSAYAIPELPEDTIGYVYKCDVCDFKIAYHNKLTNPEPTCTYVNCRKGIYRESGLCSIIPVYSVTCKSCNRNETFESLPVGTADAPYGTCRCGKSYIESGFRIDYKYLQYTTPCFYCFKAQVTPHNIDEETESCPYCGKPYYTPFPDTVDENGNLLYGGGGPRLFYCKKVDKFYVAVKDEESGMTDDTCPYCNRSHLYNGITILYCTNCPSCGAFTERPYLESYKTPWLMATLANIFTDITVDITGNFDINAYKITTRCYECNYDFSKDNSLVITRHVDAPKNATYERHENDRPFSETDTYSKDGSYFDNIFQRMIWRIKYIKKYIIDFYIAGFRDLLGKK